MQPFLWNEDDEALDEHVSRLEWLLLDLLHVSEAEPERFERKKAAIEAALYKVYRDGLDRDFKGFAQALQSIPEGKQFITSLFPFTEGKFAKLFQVRPDANPSEGVYAVCYDFLHLTEHRDFAALALRLCVYEIRRFAARMSRRRHRTFLVIDESWALLEAGTGGGVASLAGPFLSSSVRMGRKEGMSVIGLSQVIEDFVRSPYGAAIVGQQQHEDRRPARRRVGRGPAGPPPAHGSPGRAGPPAVANAPLSRVPAHPGGAQQRGPGARGPVQQMGVHDQPEGPRAVHPARRGAA